ncbi:MAG: V-type ATPase subunit [Provencibacterium sp.]|nr:V-type ATPase subunit [Provencibacterium sp.]
MLESLSSTAILTKVKAMSGHMLTNEDYEQLMHRDSVAACAAYLKSQTSYAQVLQDVQETQIHRGTLEALLQKTLFEQFVRLQRYAGKNNRFFRDSYVARLEIRCISVCIRLLNSGSPEEFIRTIPGYILPYLTLDISALSSARDYRSLLEALRRTPYYRVLEPFYPKNGENAPLPLLEHALYSYYYRYVCQLIERQFHSSTKKELLNIFTIQAQLQDIGAVFRLKSFFGSSKEEIRQLLLNIEGPLPRRLMRAILDAPNGDEVISLLAASRYGRYFDEAHFIYIENSTGAIRHNLARRYLTFSQNPATAFAAFIVLREIEIENLMAIIEGARYQLPPSKLRPLLIRGGA